MDPIQFRVDWDVLIEVLSMIIVLAFFVERALSIVVENRLFINSKLDDNGFKEILEELLLAVVSTRAYHFFLGYFHAGQYLLDTENNINGRLRVKLINESFDFLGLFDGYPAASSVVGLRRMNSLVRVVLPLLLSAIKARHGGRVVSG